MKQERLTYVEPVMNIREYTKHKIFTLTTSTEYDADKIENSGNIPSIDDIINGR